MWCVGTVTKSSASFEKHTCCDVSFWRWASTSTEELPGGWFSCIIVRVLCGFLVAQRHVGVDILSHVASPIFYAGLATDVKRRSGDWLGLPTTQCGHLSVSQDVLVGQASWPWAANGCFEPNLNSAAWTWTQKADTLPPSACCAMYGHVEWRTPCNKALKDNFESLWPWRQPVCDVSATARCVPVWGEWLRGDAQKSEQLWDPFLVTVVGIMESWSSPRCESTRNVLDVRSGTSQLCAVWLVKSADERETV